MEVLQKVIAACGSQAKLAERIGVSPMCISMWKKRGQVPAARVIQVERATGGQVTRYEIRPDLYPIERVQLVVNG